MCLVSPGKVSYSVPHCQGRFKQIVSSGYVSYFVQHCKWSWRRTGPGTIGSGGGDSKATCGAVGMESGNGGADDGGADEG